MPDELFFKLGLCGLLLTALIFIVAALYRAKYNCKQITVSCLIFAGVSFVCYSYFGAGQIIPAYYSASFTEQRIKHQQDRLVYAEIKKSLAHTRFLIEQQPSEPGLWLKMSKLYALLDDQIQSKNSLITAIAIKEQKNK